MHAFRRYLSTFSGFDRDARLFLLTTLVAGAAISLFWIDFNLYLAALGLPASTIGLIATGGPLASAITAIPASLISDRIGRRTTLIAGTGLMAAAFLGLIFARGEPVLFLLAMMYGTGQQIFLVVQIPFLTERSRPDQRNELFSLQSAVFTGTSIGAALIGGAVAAVVSSVAGIGAGSPDVYRVLLLVMFGLTLVAMLTLLLLRDDRRSHRNLDRPPDPVDAGRQPSPALATVHARPTPKRPADHTDPTDGDLDAVTTEGTRSRRRWAGRLLDRAGMRVQVPGLFFRLLLPGFLDLPGRRAGRSRS